MLNRLAAIKSVNRLPAPRPGSSLHDLDPDAEIQLVDLAG